ncbi:MAG: hypothetical protein EP347_10110 [Alphaproteobacteria bacterium]|nr:MAG: hypothetical protein EP347_10110 [Alphaproteobacteria bacterium]
MKYILPFWLIAVSIAMSFPVAASDENRITVAFQPASQSASGISPEVAAALQLALEQKGPANFLIDLSTDVSKSEFDLLSSSEGTLHLIGPLGRLRNSFTPDTDADVIVHALYRHAEQKALLQLVDKSDAHVTHEPMLELSLTRVYLTGSADQCIAGLQDAAQTQWQQAPANAEQIVPLCHAFRLQVKLKDTSQGPLFVAGLALSNDGSIYDVPGQGSKTLLHPGDTYVFPDIYQGTPPLNAEDRFIVFGTPKEDHILWSRLTEIRQSQSLKAPSSVTRGENETAPQHAKEPGNQGAPLTTFEKDQWTVSELSVRVLANLLSADQEDPSGGTTSGPSTREMTVSHFNIGPYLPYRASPTLHRVLLVADNLTYYALKDGVRYKQHGWLQTNDRENLKEGIDCSRSIWYAFTRADLPYNTGNRYLPTAAMASSNSPMTEYFQSCNEADELQTGDILVYRNAANTKGHTVMVIDPARRIAWGSHYWDGANPGLGDNGVEYQQINLSKRDWPQWDTSTTLKQCWRYKDFIAEREKFSSEPVNLYAMENIARVCKDPESCGSIFFNWNADALEEGIIFLQTGEEFKNRGTGLDN